jgi:16S rRNA (cytosine967-C5)-methyltransferase
VKAAAARLAALETVSRVRERNAYAHETLDAVLAQRALAPNDAALATRLAYGTIAARGTLDAAISRYLAADVRLEPKVSDALAVGAYEVLFLRTPAHAAVSQAVELTRSVRPAAAGLANAVMRKLVASAADFPWGDTDTDDGALARLHAHPDWLADLWIRELGRERAAAIMAADNEPAPLYLAALAFARPAAEMVAQLDAEGVSTSPCPPPGCLLADNAASARRSAVVASREALVVDAAAQLAAHIVRPADGRRIIEVGAGRGTKSLLIAALARVAGGRAAQVVAIDSHGFKLEALERTAQLLGATEISTAIADASTPDSVLPVADGSADAVLVDAPCSGLGTLRRHPDRRWRAQPHEIDALADLGSRLLARAARLVKPGGFVVYSTCTIARRENEDVVEGFLGSADGRGFSADGIAEEVPAEWRRFVTPEGWFQSLPEPGGPDGHFIARLVRG